MARTSPQDVINAEIEAAFWAGIMQCLVHHCGIDSAKADKMVAGIASMPNTLADRQRTARERISSSILAAVAAMGERTK